MSKELQDALREGAARVGEGSIRIDARRALERLKSHRFADPAHWVLEVLRAAVASRAKRVAVRTDADDVEVRFDGEPFPERLMRELLDQALRAGTTPDERRTRLLALGVAGALGLEPKFIVVASGGVRLELAGGDVRVSSRRQAGTFLHVRKRLGWRVAASFVSGAGEVAAIRKRARRYPVHLRLNDEPVAVQASLGATTDQLTRSLDGVSLVAGVPQGAPPPASRVELDVLGVTVATRTLVLPGLQCVAWVRGDEMRRNASGSDVVDDDPSLKAALASLEDVSLTLLSRALASTRRLAPATRDHLVQLLTREDSDRRVIDLLKQAPLVPGPADERYSIVDFEAQVRKGTPVYVTDRRWPAGSYPTPCALLEEGSSFDRVLPRTPRQDIAEVMQSRATAARNRQLWEASPVEPATLAGTFVARAPIPAQPSPDAAVVGEVGLREPPGAFVRILHQGRLFQQQEVSSLAPLRLHAVVDLRQPLPDAVWEEVPSRAVWELVSDEVWQAVTRAVLSCVDQPAGRRHGLALLRRLAQGRRPSISDLPRRLIDAPLFECLGGQWTSLATLLEHEAWRFVPSPHEGAPLLSGVPVLVLTPELRELLHVLAGGRLVDARPQLLHEVEVRRRLNGPKAPAVVAIEHVVAVPVEGEGLLGEVAVPVEPGSRLALTLLRDGVMLEELQLAARYGVAVAAVDCAALTPNPEWTGVVRDDVYARVTAAVGAAQRALAWALAQECERRRQPFHELPRGAQRFLSAFLRAELASLAPDSLDDVQRAVASVRVFPSLGGLVSLLDLHAAFRRSGTLWCSSQEHPPPTGYLVLLARAELPALVGDLLGTTARDLQPELARIAARRRFESQPAQQVSLPAGLRFVAEASARDVRCRGALAGGLEPLASVDVFVNRRLFVQETFPAQLPLRVVAEADQEDPTCLGLSDHGRSGLLECLRLLEARVLDAAFAAGDADGRRAQLIVLGAGQTALAELPDRVGQQLLAAPVFPCTDGQTRAANQLEAPVQYVTTALEGAPHDGGPVVVATEPAVRLGLQHWKARKDVTGPLAEELRTRAARSKLPQVARIEFKGEALWRRPLASDTLVGEVVVTPLASTRLELYERRRPLAAIDGELPRPLSAAVNCDELRPGVTRGTVAKGQAYEGIVAAVLAEAKLLADDVATAVSVAPAELDDRARRAALRLAFWLATAFVRKGKKKKREKSPHLPGLLRVPLLVATDGHALSVGDLLEWARRDHEVPHSRLAGSPLEPGRRLWRPREGELALAVEARLPVREASSELERAAEVRARPRVDDLGVPVDSAWRAPLSTETMEGEVALPSGPGDPLEIELLRERTRIEVYQVPHPVGGRARVNCDQLAVDDRWTTVVQDKVFRDLVVGVVAELERLVARRLAEGEQDFYWRRLAMAAIRWKGGRPGPLAAVLPGLPLFASLTGAAVPVGAVLAEYSQHARVAVAAPGLRPDPDSASLVLVNSPENLELLEALDFSVSDITKKLERLRDEERSRKARRLASLAVAGDALVRVPVQTPDLRGEVALALDPATPAEVTLVKEGVAVCALDGPALPGVAGVLEVKGLVVNSAWTKATLSRGERAAVLEQLELPYRELVKRHPSLRPEERLVAGHHVLELLASEGVKAAAHLDRLTGLPAALLDLGLFPTVSQQWVSVRALAALALSKRPVAVMARRLFRPDVGREVVLEAKSLDAPWLAALEQVLGEGTVMRVVFVEAWRAELAALDPPEGTPEAEGLGMIRAAARLLRAGALGRLTPNELEEVRLRRAGGKRPIVYDAEKKVVWLDPGAPLVARTLAEATRRPERVWVLLAAAFGTINRALERVTDEDEALLLLALVAHLAANPSALEPGTTPAPGPSGGGG